MDSLVQFIWSRNSLTWALSCHKWCLNNKHLALRKIHRIPKDRNDLHTNMDNVHNGGKVNDKQSRTALWPNAA